MTVYLASRRGNWLFALICFVFGTNFRWCGPLRRLLRWLARDTWMSSSICVTMRCRGAINCTVCRRLGRNQDSESGHVLLARLDPVKPRALQVEIDCAFDDPSAWLFIRLAKCSNEQAITFFSEHEETTYNHVGQMRNFVGLPRIDVCAPACCRSKASGYGSTFFAPVGVKLGEKTNTHTPFFCSEFAATLLAECKYELGVAPCLTTPQMLVTLLADHYPIEIDQQFTLAHGATIHTNYEQMFAPLPI